MGPSDPYYSSGLVKDEKITAKTGETVVLNWTPVKVNTFSIIDSKGNIGIADAFGNITFAGDGGNALVTPAGTITGLKDGEYTVTYKFDNNSVKSDGYTDAGYTNAPAAELQIKSIPVNAETRTLRAYWALSERQASRYSDVA